MAQKNWNEIESNRITLHCMSHHSVNYKNKENLTLLRVLLNIVDDNFHQNTIIDHNH
jgi:hypothetical protein